MRGDDRWTLDARGRHFHMLIRHHSAILLKLVDVHERQERPPRIELRRALGLDNLPIASVASTGDDDTLDQVIQ
jgi:hypothetical protein